MFLKGTFAVHAGERSPFKTVRDARATTFFEAHSDHTFIRSKCEYSVAQHAGSFPRTRKTDNDGFSHDAATYGTSNVRAYSLTCTVEADPNTALRTTT